MKICSWTEVHAEESKKGRRLIAEIRVDCHMLRKSENETAKIVRQALIEAGFPDKDKENTVNEHRAKQQAEITQMGAWFALPYGERVRVEGWECLPANIVALRFADKARALALAATDYADDLERE